VSLVAVIHDPAHAKTTSAYFMDFLREPIGPAFETRWVSTLTINPMPSANCYGCHKSAVLPIHPKWEFGFDEKGVTVQRPAGSSAIPALLERSIESYGLVDMKHFDQEASGPSLGAAEKCADCHDKFAKLNFEVGVTTDRESKSFEAKKGLVQTYIEQGYMPPGAHLSPAERTALWESIKTNYYDQAAGNGAFIDWLKGR
jgi:hypothetical protein